MKIPIKSVFISLEDLQHFPCSNNSILIISSYRLRSILALLVNTRNNLTLYFSLHYLLFIYIIINIMIIIKLKI